MMATEITYQKIWLNELRSKYNVHPARNFRKSKSV